MITLLKSAKIVDHTSPFHNKKMDLLIDSGKIVKVAENIVEDETYNCVKLDNLVISNGWFDTSVCFGEPGYEDNETIENGLKVAARSGFTSVAVNPYTEPIADNKSVIQYIKSKAFHNAVNLYPIGALTQKSAGLEMSEMFDMQEQGAIAFGDYKKPIVNSNILKIALLYAQNFDGMVMSFPKDIAIAQNGLANEGVNSTKLGLKGIPNLAEELQISRDLSLLEYTGGKLHIPTISTANSVDLIREAKAKGLNVTCSVATANLVMTDDKLENFESVYKLNPPLRTEVDRLALVKGVKDGVIDVITSDHSPIDVECKKVEFAIAKDGSIGLESAFRVLTTIFDIETIVKCIEENPKRIFGIEKNTIAEGSKADLTLFTSEAKGVFSSEDILSTSKNSAFVGLKTKGIVYGIYNNNQLVLNK